MRTSSNSQFLLREHYFAACFRQTRGPVFWALFFVAALFGQRLGAQPYPDTYTNTYSVTVKVWYTEQSIYPTGPLTSSSTSVSPGGTFKHGTAIWYSGGKTYEKERFITGIDVPTPPPPPKTVVRTESKDTSSDSWNTATYSDSWGTETSSDSWNTATSSDSWNTATSSDSWNAVTSSDSWNAATYSDSWGEYKYSEWAYKWTYGTWSPSAADYWEDTTVEQKRTNTYTAKRTYGRTGTRTYSQTGTRTYSQTGTRSYSQTGTRRYSQTGTRTYSQTGTRRYSQTGTRSWTRTTTTYYSDGSTSSAVTSTWTEALSKSWTEALSPRTRTQSLSNSWTDSISRSWTEALSKPSSSESVSRTWTEALSSSAQTETTNGSNDETQTVQGTKPLNWKPYDKAMGAIAWGAWSPDVSTVAVGTTFTQTCAGTQPWQRGETNDRGDSRNVVDYTKDFTDSRPAIGTKPLTATVLVVVNGSGSVSGGGTFPIGSTATLVPAAGPTSYFAGFSGDVIGGGATEANPSPSTPVLVDKDKNVFATFNPKQPQLIGLANPGAQILTVPPFLLAWSNTSGLMPLFSVVSGPAIVDPTGRVTVLGLGTVIIRASHPGSVFYLPANPVDVSFEVGAPPAYVIMDAQGAATNVQGKISGKQATATRQNTTPVSDSARSRAIKEDSRNKTGAGVGTGGSTTNTGKPKS